MTSPHAFAGQDEQFRHAFQILASGIERRAFPGASVAVVHHGALVGLKALGRFTYDHDSPLVTVKTIYDLASVTKVIATTALCMTLWERGTLALEAKLAEALPEFADALRDDQRRREVTFRMLLAHSSGLPAYLKLFSAAKNREEALAQALQAPLEADPGSRAAYSDIGFILLGLALERLAGEPLDRLCRGEIFAQLGLQWTSYQPPSSWKNLIPPTADDRVFRHKVIQGEVHDENAWLLGGVAGHAGCFATAEDLAAFSACLLRGGGPLFRPETMRLFTRRESLPQGTSRALGWDTPSTPSQSGQYFSPGSYGHLGFTGTSLWIDPERQLAVALLTNRTWPNGGSDLIREIRPAFHDAVVEALQ